MLWQMQLILHTEKNAKGVDHLIYALNQYFTYYVFFMHHLKEE